MKILVVNDLFRYGGAEYIANMQYNILKRHDNDTYLLTFDPNLIDGWNTKKHYNIKMSSKYIFKVINKLIFNPFLYYRIISFLKIVTPRVILIHSFIVSPITKYLSIGNKIAIQTVHDFFYICPKYDCINKDYKICSGIKSHNCFKEGCQFGGSKLKLAIFFFHTISLSYLRKKKIRIFISPSNCLAEYLEAYGYKNIVINNPYPVENKITYIEKKENIFLYVGKISEHKGIYRFIYAFKNFSTEQDKKLYLIGDFQTREDKSKLHEIICDCPNIKYFGKMPHDMVLKYMEKCKFLVVPSLWMENYATVILEGFSKKVYIIGSDRGGNKELLSNDRGTTFDILDNDDIKRAMKKVMNISSEDYRKIVNKNYEYVKTNNSQDVYYCRIMETIFKELA